LQKGFGKQAAVQKPFECKMLTVSILAGGVGVFLRKNKKRHRSEEQCRFEKLFPKPRFGKLIYFTPTGSARAR